MSTDADRAAAEKTEADKKAAEDAAAAATAAAAAWPIGGFSYLQDPDTPTNCPNRQPRAHPPNLRHPPPPPMSLSSSSDETAVASVSSEDDDISLPPSPSPSPEPSPEPYASSSDGAAAPPAKKPRRPRSGIGARPRSWPAADEVVLLEAVVAHRERHGRLPSRDDLAAALAGRLRYSGEQAAERVSSLRKRYYGSVRRLSRGTVPVTDGDMRVYKLSKRLWEGTLAERARRAADRAAARHHERRGFAELEALYPCLAAEVGAIASRRRPCGVLKTAFGLIGDERAAALEAKVRKQRRAELKAGMKRAELRDQVARTLLEFIE